MNILSNQNYFESIPSSVDPIVLFSHEIVDEDPNSLNLLNLQNTNKRFFKEYV